MKTEDIEKLMEQVKESIIEFKGGHFMKVKVIGHMNRMVVPFGAAIDADFDTKLKEEEKPDAEIYRRSFIRIIRKGNIETAWSRVPNSTVVRLGMEEIIIDETLDSFIKRVGWSLGND